MMNFFFWLCFFSKQVYNVMVSIYIHGERMMRKRLYLCLLIISTVFLLGATETDDVLDKIYEGEFAPLKESVWLVLNGAGRLNESDNLSEADAYIESKGWSSDYLTKGQLALMLAENFELPRGILYQLFPTPRYALKDMIYLNIMDEGVFINDPLTGFALINGLSSALGE